MRNNLNLRITLLTDSNHISQIPHSIINFDFVVEEFLERRDVEDFIGGGLGCVDDELYRPSVSRFLFRWRE